MGCGQSKSRGAKQHGLHMWTSPSPTHMTWSLSSLQPAKFSRDSLLRPPTHQRLFRSGSRQKWYSSHQSSPRGGQGRLRVYNLGFRESWTYGALLHFSRPRSQLTACYYQQRTGALPQEPSRCLRTACARNCGKTARSHCKPWYLQHSGSLRSLPKGCKRKDFATKIVASVVSTTCGGPVAINTRPHGFCAMECGLSHLQRAFAHARSILCD